MSRRTTALVGVGALTALSALTAATSAHASTQHHPRATTPSHSPSTHLQRASARAAAGSIAAFGTSDGGFQMVKSVNGTKAKKSAFFSTGGDPVGTSINPVGGAAGLFCTEDDQIFVGKGLRTMPNLLGTTIDASGFTGEGGASYNMFCYSASVHGSFALVTADSQGLLQLVRKNGAWKIDKRVKSPGLNDAGDPHLPGWIDIRDRTTKGTLFDTVAIAPKARPNGKFLAVTADREGDNKGDQTIVVVSGVGTAKPQVTGAVSSGSLVLDDVNFGELDYGNGGMAFLPGSADKALVLTKTGFAVLNLHDPAHPTLKHKVVIPQARDTDFDPTSLTISRDGNHVAVSVGKKIYVYKNVLAAVSQGQPFRKQGSFTVSSSSDDIVSDVAFTSNNTLLVLHGSSATTDGWSLTVVKKVASGHHAIKGSTATTAPEQPGSLSVWP